MGMKTFRFFHACLFTLLTVFAWGMPGTTAPAATDNSTLAYIGTYTGPKSKGIYSFRLDSSGAITAVELAAETPQPTFLAIHPNQRFLYAANEVDHFGGKKSGAVSAFSIDAKTGKLTLLNQQPSGGAGPCHLFVDRTGKNVLVANYGGGSVEVLPLQDDGRLAEPSTFIQHQGSSTNPRRQSGPHSGRRGRMRTLSRLIPPTASPSLVILGSTRCWSTGLIRQKVRWRPTIHHLVQSNRAQAPAIWLLTRRAAMHTSSTRWPVPLQL